MQNILKNRVFRDLKENLLRYLALFMLIVLGMYIIISLVGAADTIIIGVDKKAEENNLEDGQFQVFVPLTKEEMNSLTKQGITLEAMFYMDFAAKDNSTIRVFQNRENINLIELEEGRLPQEEKEAVLEKRYCEEQDIHLEDKIFIGGISFQVVGIGTVPDYDAPYKNLSDSSVESKQFGLAFVTKGQYEILKESGVSEKTEEYVYAYRLNDKMTQEALKSEIKEMEISAGNVKDPYFQEYWEKTAGQKEQVEEGIKELLEGSKNLDEALEQLNAYKEVFNQSGLMDMAAYLQEAKEGSTGLYEGMQELDKETSELLDTYFDSNISNLTHFMTAEDNPRIKASSDDQVINKMAGLIAGVIVMALFTYVISVFVIHGIERESSVIGALYAMGVKKEELMIHYLLLPVLITFLAGLTGTVIGYSKFGINIQMRDCFQYFSIPALETVYAPWLVCYGVVMPPLVAAVVNSLVIRKKLSRPALELIRNETRQSPIRNMNLGNMGFIGRFRIRQMIRELRTSITVMIGMFISLLILMMGIDCYVLCEHISTENKRDTKYEYMYTYKYPEKEVPEGGEACFAKTLKKEIFGYNLEVMLLGIEKENPYFDADVKKGKNRVIISSAMAQKYQLSVGDKLVLSDEEEEMDYVFQIDGITQFSTGLYVFMDIDSMRELFLEEEDYYNVVLSDKELDIESGRLFSVTTKEEISKSSDVFTSLMMPMVYMMTIVAALIFCVVMYLMMKVMIDRSSFSISLVKIFGYRMSEIRKLYLNGNFYMIAIGAAICIPLSKGVMDAMYPALISNVACGMNLTFPLPLYLAIYSAVLVLYFIINGLLVIKLNKVIPAEVLKNRE